MAKPILDDSLWTLMEPLLPAPKKRRRRYPGRKPIGHRQRSVAFYSCCERAFPGNCYRRSWAGEWMSCWRRLSAWQKQGVWKKVHAALLAHLQQADQIDWSRAVVDSSSVLACMVEKNGPHRQIAGRRGRSIISPPMETGFPSQPR